MKLGRTARAPWDWLSGFGGQVVLGTSLGLLYALDAKTGFVLGGWPLQLGPIEAQVGSLPTWLPRVLRAQSSRVVL